MDVVIIVCFGRMRRTACGLRGVLCVVVVEGYNKELKMMQMEERQRERTMKVVSLPRNVYCLALDQNLTSPG